MSLNNTVGNNFLEIRASNVLPAKLFLMKNFFSSLVRAEAVMRQIQDTVIRGASFYSTVFNCFRRKEFTWKCSHLHLVFSIQLYASCFVILIPKSPTINQVSGCWGESIKLNVIRLFLCRRWQQKEHEEKLHKEIERTQCLVCIIHSIGIYSR